MTEIQLLQEIADLLRTRHPANEVMGIEEAAAYLGIQKTFLAKLVSLRKIPAAYPNGIGKRRRVLLRKVDLDAFLESRLVRTEADAVRMNDGRRRAA